MKMKPPITTLSDIQLLVDTFYQRVRKDELLGPIFEGVIQNHWSLHLEKMYRFWQTVLLGEHTYFGSPFLPHALLPIGEEEFDQWIFLFKETVDSCFEGDKAEEAKWRAERMARMFAAKIEHYRGKGTRPLV